MHTIEVDFDVLKELMARRETEAVTYNDVLRRLLNLDTSKQRILPGAAGYSDAGSWVTKSVRFPAGTEFRATHKGKLHTGVVQGGRLVVNGKGYESPSAAAVAITGNPVNGWTFWECRRPGETRWQVLKGLRTAA
jgi:hypothetical protein